MEMEHTIDELYVALDEMNSRIEEMVLENEDPEIQSMLVSTLNEKIQEFVFDMQEEAEKMKLVGVEI